MNNSKFIGLIFFIFLMKHSYGQELGLYGILREFSTQDDYLAKIDPATGNVTILSDSPVGNTTTGNSTIDPINNRFFFASQNYLITIDLLTGDIIYKVEIPNASTSNLNLFAFNCSDSLLYGILREFSTQDDYLAQIDPTTGNVTILSSSAVGNTTAGNSTIDPINNRFFFASQNYLVTIDLLTGDIIYKVEMPNTSTSNLNLFAFNDICPQFKCKTSTGTDIQIACNSFTWIDGVTYTASNDSATYTLVNSAGCDSVITLNLIVNSVITSVTKNENILTSDEPDGTYQWLDCAKDYVTITGEINKSFNPKSSGSYAVEVTKNGCVDTSNCNEVQITGILYKYNSEVITVYPNPSSGDITIKFENCQYDVTISLIDLTGNVISKNIYSSIKELSYDINALNGLYLIDIKVKDNKSTLIKVLKN